MEQQTNMQGWHRAVRRGALNAPASALAHKVLERVLMVYSRHGYVTRALRFCPAQKLDFLHECCKGVRYPFAQRAQKLGNSLTTVIPQKCGIHTIEPAVYRGVCFGAVTAGLACFLVLWAAKVHGMDPAWDCGMTVRGVV